MAVMTSVGKPSGLWAREVRGPTSSKLRAAREDCPMKPFLFRRCRSEKDDSDGVDGNKIRATLVTREARGIICRNFDRRVAGRGWSNVDVSGGYV